ncbi:unnamed protein product, partial [Phaeothamnion confervicola]
MYVIQEMEDAVVDSLSGNRTNNDAPVQAWDEAWAFYAGSQENTDGSGEGDLLYSLADKRRTNVSTGTGDDDGDDSTGTSAVNAAALELSQQGHADLNAEPPLCSEIRFTIYKMVNLMTVSLVQGTLRYLYFADPAGGNEGDKARSELWAFVAAVLPRVGFCDATVAEKLYENAYIGNAASVTDGCVAMKASLETVYECLGITCANAGGLLADDGGYVAGFEPCQDA